MHKYTDNVICVLNKKIMNTLKIIFLAIFILYPSIGFSQQFLELKEGNCKVKNQYFDSVLVWDNRADTNKPLGKIKVDYRKGHESLLSKSSLKNDIAQFYSNSKHTDSPITKRKLAVVIYQFLAEEKIPGLDDETAGFNYSADYFTSTSDSTFQLLFSIDTNVFVQSYDVTKSLLRAVNDVLCLGIKNIDTSKPSSDYQFNREELSLLNSEHIKYFKAYTHANIEDGVYKTWNDFLIGRKMNNMITESYDGTYIIRRLTTKGKKQFITPKHAIAVCEGIPYYMHDYGPKYMKKDGDDYKILTNIRVSANKKYEDAYIGVSLLAATVLAIALPFSFSFYFSPMHSKNYVYKRFECKINPRTGSLIPIKHISNKELKEKIKTEKAAAKELIEKSKSE